MKRGKYLLRAGRDTDRKEHISKYQQKRLRNLGEWVPPLEEVKVEKTAEDRYANYATPVKTRPTLHPEIFERTHLASMEEWQRLDQGAKGRLIEAAPKAFQFQFATARNLDDTGRAYHTSHYIALRHPVYRDKRLRYSPNYATKAEARVVLGRIMLRLQNERRWPVPHEGITD